MFPNARMNVKNTVKDRQKEKEREQSSDHARATAGRFPCWVIPASSHTHAALVLNIYTNLHWLSWKFLSL